MFLKRGVLVCSFLLLLTEAVMGQAVPPPIPPPPPPGLPINEGQIFLLIVGLVYGVYLKTKTLRR